jgi:hypothetical protein
MAGETIDANGLLLERWSVGDLHFVAATAAGSLGKNRAELAVFSEKLATRYQRPSLSGCYCSESRCVENTVRPFGR